MAEPDGAVPDLSGLPGWVQWAVYGLFALGIVAAGVVGRLGLLNGRAAPAEGASKGAAVAAVIVDPEALNRLTAAGQALNETLGQVRDLMGQFIADQHEERQEREIEEEVDRRVTAQLKERRTRQRRLAKRPAG